MKRTVAVLAAGIGLSVAAAPQVRAEARREGCVFKLRRAPLPVELSSFRPPSQTLLVKSISKLPPSIEAAEALEAGIHIRQGYALYRQVILSKSDGRDKRYDRLWVDADGDGRFAANECHDITKSAGSVVVELDQGSYHRTRAGPIELAGCPDRPDTAYWVLLEVNHTRDGATLTCGSVTCVMGRVKFGGDEVLLGIYDPHLSGRFDRYVTFPIALASRGRTGTRTGCHLLLDVSGNVRFDRVDPMGMGPENRWLTRLLRYGDAFYMLNVARDGRSIRITPTAPKLGTVTIPDDLPEASIVGPEYAAVMMAGDEPLQVPVGLYAVRGYAYQKDGFQIRTTGLVPNSEFRVEPGKTASIQAGPPLRLAVSLSATPGSLILGPPKRLNMTLEVTDDLGRKVVGLRTPTDNAGPNPRFTIVDEQGKTVLKGEFRRHGCGGIADTYSVRVPSDWQGNYRIIPEWSPSPIKIAGVRPTPFRAGDDLYPADTEPVDQTASSY